MITVITPGSVNPVGIAGGLTGWVAGITLTREEVAY